VTPLGDSQCESLNKCCNEKNSVKNVELLLVSPMRRTLATATQSFPGFIDGIPWMANELLREMSGSHPCDRRRPISELKSLYPHVDFSLTVDNEDPLYYAQVGRESPESVTKRQRDFFSWLATRGEGEILVVSHSAYFHNMFKNVLDADLAIEHGRCGVFKNCEMKSYYVSFPQVTV
jgi:broad specificity phosphatase PhoE